MTKPNNVQKFISRGDLLKICSDLQDKAKLEDYQTIENIFDELVKFDDIDGPLKVPVLANIDAAILEQVSLHEERFDMSDWHSKSNPEDEFWSDEKQCWLQDKSCGTKHCRAGWAIHLAGKAGYNLENRFGAEYAGTMIYLASRPTVEPPAFDATDEDALKSIIADASKYSE